MRRHPNHDDYIRHAADFAQPILTKLRKVVHKACPKVQESIKWNSPHFELQGMLCGMNAFKKHVVFAFWRGAELSDTEGLLERMGKTGIAGMKLETVADVPGERVLVRYIREAAALNEAGRAAPRRTSAEKAPRKATVRLAAPPDLLAALKKNKAAHAAFEGFSNSNRKEYVEWVTEAKREATRERRIAQAVEWMAEGKPRNWKYMKEWA